MIRSMARTDSRRDDKGLSYARLFGVGFTLLFTLVALATVGFFLDRLAGTMPLFLLLGLGLGFAGGLYFVYRALETLDGR